MKFPLPYGFARENQLLLEDDGTGLTLVVHAGSVRAAVGEVLRKHAVESVSTLPAEALVQRISAAYSQGESSAALVAVPVGLAAQVLAFAPNGRRVDLGGMSGNNGLGTLL